MPYSNIWEIYVLEAVCLYLQYKINMVGRMCNKICVKITKILKFKNLCCLSNRGFKKIKRKPRCLKLRHRKLQHMFGLSNLKVWDNPPIAPPA